MTKSSSTATQAIRVLSELRAALGRIAAPGTHDAIVDEALRRAGLPGVPVSEAELASFVLGPLWNEVTAEMTEQEDTEQEDTEQEDTEEIVLAKLLGRPSRQWRAAGLVRSSSSGVFQKKMKKGAGNPHVIVVANAEPVARSLIKLALVRRGFRVLTSLDWQRAVQLCGRHAAELAIFDTAALGPHLDLTSALLASALSTALPPIIVVDRSVGGHIAPPGGPTILGRPLQLNTLIAAVEERFAALRQPAETHQAV